MLDRPHRLTSSAGFTKVTRGGRRVGGRTLVLHHLSDGTRQDARVGFVVGKAVGAAVTRNRVRRRLRHLMRARLGLLGPGSMVVVRALPAAADVGSPVLARDLDAGLRRLGLTEAGCTS